jgi:hypothetical protein
MPNTGLSSTSGLDGGVLNREDHKERKGISLRDMRSFLLALFVIFAVRSPASDEKSSGAYGIIPCPS